jgi:NAD(P)H-flavin reductase
MINPYLIHPATIMERIREADSIHTYRLRLNDEETRRNFRFTAGQFNMVYLFGVGEVATRRSLRGWTIPSDPWGE